MAIKYDVVVKYIPKGEQEEKVASEEYRADIPEEAEKGVKNAYEVSGHKVLGVKAY